MRYLTVEPEIAGSPGSAAAGSEVSFDTWLGDDLVRAFPMFLVTKGLRDALGKAGVLTGFGFGTARIRSSPFFRKHNPGRRLPRFWALRVSGRPGRDDMGLTGGGVLVVSRPVLDVLLDFRIARATLAQYTPTDACGPPRTVERGTRGS